MPIHQVEPLEVMNKHSAKQNPARKNIKIDEYHMQQRILSTGHNIHLFLLKNEEISLCTWSQALHLIEY